MARIPTDFSAEDAVCYRCGKHYNRHRDNFPVSHAAQHRGVGYIPVCKDCIEAMYSAYLVTCKDPKIAVRLMCRRLDIYWSETVFDSEMKKNVPRTVMSRYLSRMTTSSYAGKSFDDTLIEAKALLMDPFDYNRPKVVEKIVVTEEEENEPEIEIPDEVKSFWGIGYTPEMYAQLEQRRQYWMERLPDEFDTGVGSEAIIRQICSLELDINRDRAAGKNVDKMATTVANLIGSLNLKPVQLKNDDQDAALSKTPMGVWLYKYEHERPLPKVHDENAIRKQVFTWMGHVCKMLGKKNAYSKLYDDEIKRLRVERPEYEEEEDDEEFMMDIMEETNGTDEQTE